MEILMEDSSTVGEFVFSNIVDETLDGAKLEIVIKRSRGSEVSLITVYIALEIPDCAITQADIDEEVGCTIAQADIDEEVGSTELVLYIEA